MAIGIILLVVAAGAEAQNPTTADVDEIFAFLDGGPGCAVAAVRDGQVVYSSGHGLANVEFRVPITPQTVFDLASTSKQFTAAAMLLLAREGRLDLDDPVIRHMPELQHLTPAVTLRHLVHHTSGIRDYFGLWSLSGRDIDDAMPLEVILDLIGHQRTLNFEPGAREMYSNSNYMLMAEVVARVSGMSFGEFVEARLFRPLGMSSARIYDDVRELVPARAEGYREVAVGEVGRHVLRSTIVGDGGVYATVEDLARWAANFDDDKVGVRGLMDLMLTRGILNDGTKQNYAAGLRRLDYRGLPTIEHGGTMGGYRSYFRRFPTQRFTAVALCNLLELSPNELTARVGDLYLGDSMEPMEGDVPEPYLRFTSSPEPTTTGAPANVDLSDYAGVYATDELFSTSTVRAAAGVLTFQVGRTEKSVLIHTEADTYRTSGGVRVVFHRDSLGEVSSASVFAGRVREIALMRRANSGPRAGESR